MVLSARRSAISWKPSWRLVASRFPTTGLFDRVATAADLDTVYAIESLTNPRLRDVTGQLALVPQEDRISGPGTTPIMAAFTHLNRQGSRYTDGSYGVYYAAASIHTAIAETAYHRARFLAATNEAPIEIDMRSYAADIEAEFHDVRGRRKRFAALYDPDPARYGPAQAFARELRDAGANGIVYDSVRDAGGEGVAVFRPRLIAPVVQGPHYCYVWNGTSIAEIYVKSVYVRPAKSERQSAP